MEDTSPKTCPYCGNELPNRRRKQCGKPECKRAYHNERCRIWQAEYAAKHGVSYGLKNYPEKRRALGRKHREAWRREHRDEWMGRLSGVAPSKQTLRKRKHERARRKLDRAAAGAKGRAVWFQGFCLECGESFVSHYAAQKYCCSAHKRNAIHTRRRVRKKGWRVTTVSRFRVYERDAWLCGICGDPVNRDADPSADDAPCLDHIVPIAKGGPHTEGNLQCAHRYCNSVKRDTDLCLV